jgi:hypothetical protein
VDVGALVAERDRAHGQARRGQRRGDRGLDLAVGAGHRAAVGEQHDVPLGAAQLDDDVGDPVQHAGPEQDAAQAQRLQRGGLSRERELLAQAHDVACDLRSGQTGDGHDSAPSIPS